MENKKLLYTRDEAASSLSISVRYLTTLISKGQIRPRRVGGRTLFTQRELERFANEEQAA